MNKIFNYNKSNKIYLLLLIMCFISFINISSVFAVYVADVYFVVPNTVYIIDERIEFKGYLNFTNYTNTTIVSSGYAANKTVNVSIRNSNGIYIKNHTFTTDANGSFYSRSNYFTNTTLVPLVNASTTAGNYVLRAAYIDPSNFTWFSEVEIVVVDQTIDLLSVSPAKAIYNALENVSINVQAIRLIGDKFLFISNVSVNGSLRNSSKYIIQNFSCITGNDGKCITSVTAPSSNGDYILELNNFKTFSSFSVVPFSFNVYMKDDFGKSLKNVFAVGDGARVEVRVNNASDSDSYTFSGYVMDFSGNNVNSINSTTLNSQNSFTNSFYFAVDATKFSYGAYTAYVTVSKTGDGSITATTSFEVQDWTLSVNKRDSNSGFQYDYSCFANSTLYFQAYPTFRGNGSIVPNISSNSFTMNMKDDLNNIITSGNATWNSSCGTSGCYELIIIAPPSSGKYSMYTTLSYGGALQTESMVINVISGVMSAQSTDKDGNIKELFGTNEYAYLSLSAYNLSTAAFNLSNAEIFIVSYMNGTDFSYTQVNNFDLVNSTNNNYEWAWNSTTQMIKLDVPKAGGLYDIYLFGDNRTLGAIAKFIVNPYEYCSAAKDTPGSVTTGYYYIWQFKTTDTIYFEIKLIQANNPLGKASASNLSSSNGSYGGQACVMDSTKQSVNNASLNIMEVKNIESGGIQNINISQSVCQASDNNGSYTCTVKPTSKWEGGPNIVKIHAIGQDGATSDIYTRFEARAFYLYGWSTNWQNNPSSSITLNVQMYEAGKGWWSGYGNSGGLSGTMTVKRVEYQGRDGEWIWPPVDSGYNVSLLNSSSITGSTGTINLNTSYMPGGVWKTGYYRVIIQGTTTAGDSDYGYAWFGVKLWDVHGQPIECTNNSCNYKSYFNSRENITLYIQISKAGENWWSNQNGGNSIWGNTSVGVKKISDCRKWPCKDLNSSEYTASTIYVNASSPYYYYANLVNNSAYILGINSTSGTWGTGWYSVVLNVNGTDTGYAWFNTIAFYVEAQGVNSSGSYKYNIRGSNPMYFNVSTTKSYKYQNYYWNGTQYIYSRYNSSDYVNTTVNSVVLRRWNSVTMQTKEYNYPTDINITPLTVNGTGMVNITYNNGTWPSGWYWGELTLKNSLNETSTGWLNFGVQPFRVQINVNSYNLDEDSCVNGTMYIYDPDWSSYSLFYGNYSVTSVYESIYSGYTSARTYYSNYTNTSFNATNNFTICPNSSDGKWGSGSWGGYHYINVMVRDNVYNDSQEGWIYFRTLPFQVRWNNGLGGYAGAIATSAVINTNASLTKYSSGANTSGNLSRVYQWRYDNYQSTQESYVFKVGNCYSNVSGSCVVNGTQNITIYPPSGGWKVGYNYLYADWTKTNDASSIIQDWNTIYFDGREAYNGYFDNVDTSGYWKYYFNSSENITIRLYVRNSNYAATDVNITRVQYAYSPDTCGGDYCRTYVDATSSPGSTSSGSALLKIQYPVSTNWTYGMYYIKAYVSGGGGSATITGGSVRVKDMTPPNISVTSPVNNVTYNRTMLFSATTTKNARCYLYFVSYDNFFNWYCGWINSSNASNASQQYRDACNSTKFNFNGSTYYVESVSDTYHYTCNGSYCPWESGYFMTTGQKSHSYTVNVLNWTNQSYGLQVYCYDSDYNSATSYTAFKINNTG